MLPEPLGVMPVDDGDGGTPETSQGLCWKCGPRTDKEKAHVILPSALSEMAERHNTRQILKLARDLVYKVQTLIENK